MYFSVAPPLGIQPGSKEIAGKIGATSRQLRRTSRKPSTPIWFPFGRSENRRRKPDSFNEEALLSARSDKSAYFQDLQKQIEEKRLRKQREAEEELQWQRKKTEECQSYNPFGRPGHGAPCRNSRGEVLSRLGQMRQNPVGMSRFGVASGTSQRPRGRTNFLGAISSMHDPFRAQALAEKRRLQQNWVKELDKQRREKEATRKSEEARREQEKAKDEAEFEQVRKKLATLPLKTLTASQQRPHGMFVMEKSAPPAAESARPPTLDNSGVFHDLSLKPSIKRSQPPTSHNLSSKSPRVRPIEHDFLSDILDNELNISFESPRLTNLPKTKEDALVMLDRFLKEL